MAFGPGQQPPPFEESKHPRGFHGRFAALGGSQGGHESQIASVRPTGKQADPNAYKQPSLEVLGEKPAALEYNVGLFHDPENFPNFRPEDLTGTPKEQAEKIIDHMASNMVFLYNQATPEEKHGGDIWYDSAHNIAFGLAEKYDLHPAAAAGVFAALSPNKDWDQNVEMGKRVISIYAEKQNFRFDEAMAKQALSTWDPTKPGAGGKPTGKLLEQKTALFDSYVKGIEGKTLGELKGNPLLQAVWIRTYDEAHNSQHYPVFLPDGREGPIARNAPTAKDPEGKPTTMVWQSTPMVVNAIKNLESGGDPRVIGETLGEGHKVRSFYNNILDPHSPNQDVTIDTHQVGAALMRPLGASSVPVAQNFGKAAEKGVPMPTTFAGLKGNYPFYADASREAARRLGLKDTQVLQAVTWVVKRNVLGETSDKTNKEIDHVWQDYRAGKLTQPQAQQKIWTMATEDVAAKRAVQALRENKFKEAARRKSDQGTLL